MKTLMFLIALMAFTFVSCDKSQAPTEPQTSSNGLLRATQFRDVPISVVFYNECCDELVSLSGTGHMVLRDNGRHFDVTDITGTGLSSGYTYTGNNTATHNESVNSGDGAANESVVINLNVTNDNGCSFKMQIHLHITINANGEATAVIDSIETKCD